LSLSKTFYCQLGPTLSPQDAWEFCRGQNGKKHQRLVQVFPQGYSQAALLCISYSKNFLASAGRLAYIWSLPRDCHEFREGKLGVSGNSRQVWLNVAGVQA
jgi:hypothetical protein